MTSSSNKPTHKKPKLVRDSFTIPKAEFAAIDTLKTRAMAMGTSVKKSELLRAGLMLLTGLSDAAFKSAIAAVPTLKTGRPAAEQKAEPAKAKVEAAGQPAKANAPKAAAKPAAKPVAKQAAKPAAGKPAVKRVAKSVAKPTTKPAAKPTAKSAAKPTAKKVAKPMTKAPSKPATQAKAEPATGATPAA